MSELITNTDTFDVFLCHNGEDKPEIRNIARQLAENGIKSWLDEEQIRPGTSWQTALGEQIKSIKSAAVFVGEGGFGPWQNLEIQALLSQFVKRKCPIIPVILPSAEDTPEFPWTLQNLHRVDFRVANPDPLRQLIWGITGDKPGEQSIDSLPLVSNIPERQYRAIVSPPEGEQRAQLLILLDRVKEYWVDGVLKHSLFNEVLLSLGKRTMNQAVEPPWKHFVEFPGLQRQLKTQDRKINSVFDATGLLLILGEPGSGKTTTLLELASSLISRAKEDPRERVPIVLNLSSWEKKQTLDEWIVKELSTKYRIPVKIGRFWLKNDYLLPLLDGLDEVRNALQPACVSAINEFIKKFEFIDKIGPSGLVVCCRLMEYQWLPERLKLNGAICLELLDSNEVDEFLISCGPQLTGLRRAMKVDPILQELSETPLMLSIMSLAYEGFGGNDLSKQNSGSAEEHRKQVFSLYIDRMFQRKELTTNFFSKDKTIGWLARLAKGMKENSQSVFTVEGLQSSWLNTIGQRIAYGALSALIIAFILGLGVSLSGEPEFGLYTGLIILIGIGLGCWSESPLRRGFMSTLLIGGLIVLLIVALRDGPNDGLIADLIAGLIAGLIFGISGAIGVGSLKVISPVETLHWQWKQFLKKSIQALGVGVISSLFIWLIALVKGGWTAGMLWGLFYWLTTVALVGTARALIGGMRKKVRVYKTLPNHGIHLSFKYSVLSMLTVSLIAILINLIPFVGFGWRVGLAFGLIAGLIAGINRGGSAVIKHYSLRLILWIKGYTPFKFIKFLDHCAKLIFLKKVGGGYMFIHRMILEHFANMDLKSFTAKNLK